LSVSKLKYHILFLILIFHSFQAFGADQQGGLTSLVSEEEILSVVDSSWVLYNNGSHAEMALFMESFDVGSAQSDSAILEFYYAAIICYGHLEYIDKQYGYVVQGLKIAHDLDDGWMLLSFYRELASIQDETLGQYDQAEKYYKEALKYMESVGVDSQIGLLMDVALTYTNAGRLDSAGAYYDRAFALLPQDTLMKADLYNFSAPYYIDIGELDKAERYLLYANQQWEDIEVLTMSGDVKTDLAELYLLKDDPSTALYWADKAISDLNGSSKLMTMTAVYEWKAKAEKELELVQESLASYIVVNQLRDSSEKVEETMQIGKMQLQYVVDQYETELDTLLSHNEQLSSSTKANKYALFGAGGLLLLLCGVFYKVYHKRQKRISALYNQLDNDKTALRDLQSQYELAINELEKNKRELTSTAMFVEKKDEALKSVRSLLSNVEVVDNEKIAAAIKSAKKLADNSISVNNSWESFLYFFSKVYPDFIEDIKTKYPNLNANDLRSLAYLKMGLTDKEISRLQGINTASFQKAKYRLKKKLNLESSMSLDDMIQNL